MSFLHGNAIDAIVPILQMVIPQENNVHLSLKIMMSPVSPPKVNSLPEVIRKILLFNNKFNSSKICISIHYAGRSVWCETWSVTHHVLVRCIVQVAVFSNSNETFHPWRFDIFNQSSNTTHFNVLSFLSVRLVRFPTGLECSIWQISWYRKKRSLGQEGRPLVWRMVRATVRHLCLAAKSAESGNSRITRGTFT